MKWKHWGLNPGLDPKVNILFFNDIIIPIGLQNTLHVLSHLILIKTLGDRCYYYFHLTEEETETQRR